MRTSERMRRRWPVACGALAILVILVAAVGPVSGHIRRNGDEAWYFHAATFTNQPPSERTAKDPINFIFKGGDSQASINRVSNHITEHSTANVWPIEEACTVSRFSHRMVWRSWSEADTSDKEDLNMASKWGTECSPFSSKRVHLRGWDDHEHDGNTAGHGTLDQWVVGNIHHEKPKAVVIGHKIDRDWDVMKRWFINAMAGHCSYPQWGRLSAIRGRKMQGFWSSGWIGRISMHHSNPGTCEGA